MGSLIDEARDWSGKKEEEEKKVTKSNVKQGRQCWNESSWAIKTANGEKKSMKVWSNTGHQSVFLYENKAENMTGKRGDNDNDQLNPPDHQYEYASLIKHK